MERYLDYKKIVLTLVEKGIRLEPVDYWYLVGRIKIADHLRVCMITGSGYYLLSRPSW